MSKSSIDHRRHHPLCLYITPKLYILSVMDDSLSLAFSALADPTRCQILLCLLDGPRYPTELATDLGLTKGNVSNHLACLRGCGLVAAVQEGRRQRYELVDTRLAHALGDLADLSAAIGEERCAADVDGHVARPAPRRSA